MAKNFISPHAEPGKTIADLTGIAQAKWDNMLQVELKYNEDGTWFIVATSKVATAITYTDFNTLPAGSIINYLNGGLIYVKKDNSTTWITYTGA